MRKLIFLLFFSSFLFGCKSTTGPVSTPVYFHVGDSSIYTYQTFDTTGRQRSMRYDTTSIASTNTSGNAQKFTLNNNSILVLNSTGAGTLIQLLEPETLQFAYNTQFTYNIPTNDGDTILRIDSVPTIINLATKYSTYVLTGGKTDTVITVPAGTFHTEVFHGTFTAEDPYWSYNENIFISPTDGLIQKEMYDISPESGAHQIMNLRQLIKLTKK